MHADSAVCKTKLLIFGGKTTPAGVASFSALLSICYSMRNRTKQDGLDENKRRKPEASRHQIEHQSIRALDGVGHPDGGACAADIDHRDAAAEAQTIGVIVRDVGEVHDSSPCTKSANEPPDVGLPGSRRSSTSSAGTPRSATARKSSPSKVKKVPKAASQRRIAFSSVASNTGARSPGEELMTCNTSEVAVCCSNDSRVSVRSRAFSIAITAWSAKVLTSST